MSAPKRLPMNMSSIAARLFISHVIVGALTTLLLAAVFTLGIAFSTVLLNPADYVDFAEDVALSWLMPDSHYVSAAAQNDTLNFTPPGYAMVMDASHQVVFTRNTALCTVGDNLSACAPHLVGLSAGENVVEMNGDTWIEVVLPIATGHYVIGYFVSPTQGNILEWLSDLIQKLPGLLLTITFFIMLASIPASAWLSWLFARPLLTRITRIATTSQRFADGDLGVRVSDFRRDEVGILAQQFNSMADSLQQNIHALRHLLKLNGELTVQAELDAAQRERLKLSRHLHDDLAQQLFSIAISSAALPDLIQRNPSDSIRQAQNISQLTEDALIELRTLLVDLRPGGLLESGLARGLKTLCEKWQETHHITVELSVMLRQEDFSSALQVTIYSIVQESLNNIVKHAQAKHVVVSLVQGRERLTVSISDDGIGFQPPSTPRNGQLGLLTLRERAEAFGGQLIVESDIGQGTTVRVELPSSAQERLI